MLAFKHTSAFKLKASKLTPAYGWPGGYQIIYIDSCGDVLCPDCAGIERFRTKLHSDIFWEGPNEFCAACNDEIESCYGDPDAEEKPED